MLRNRPGIHTLPYHRIKMTQTTRKQKIALVFLGVFLTLVVLELILRVGGAAFFYLQEKTNRPSFQSSEYRIMCIGESTTALGQESSYPSQLDEILNARAPHMRFK